MKPAFSLTSTRKKTYKLPEKSSKAEYVRTNFNEIAQNYDLFNDLITFGMHRLWKKKVAVLTNIHKLSAGSFLDLCTGSGDIAIALYKNKKNHSGINILAVDFSSEMLKRFQSRLRQKNIETEISLKEGDAEDLAFIPDSSLDGVTMGFGLRNVTDRKRCLNEIYRVLKPGGVFVNLDTGKVHNAAIRFFHDIFFEKIVPLIGRAIQGESHEMYEYLPESARAYPSQAELKEELLACGFVSADWKNLMFGSAVIHRAVKPPDAAALRNES